MPLYEYECESCGDRIEVLQRVGAPPIGVCESCGGVMKRLLSAPAFQFKGTGWYVTDYAKKNSSPEGESSDGKEGSKAKPKESGDAKAGTKEKEKTSSASSKDSSKKKNSALGLVGLLLLLPVSASRATSYKMISDADLATQATVIIQAVVIAREPAPIPAPPSTDYFVQVERVLKGFVAGSTVVVRLAGGIGPDGVGLRVWGSPQFQPGERVLLFLVPRPDGTYGILHLMLGAFHEVQLGGRHLAVRDLSEALQAPSDWGLLSQGLVVALDPPRRWDAFTRWLEERESGVVRQAGYLDVESAVVSSENGAPSAMLIEPCTDLGFRWFGFNRRRPISWKVNLGRLDGLLDYRDLSMALEVWEMATAGRLHLSLDGATSSEAGLSERDDLNTVLFEDPEEWIVGSYDCQAGGVLAVSGVWFESGRDQQCRVSEVGQQGRVGDRVFMKISSSDIVINNGAGCYFAGDRTRILEVVAHEVGHSLGLAHADEAEALMFGPAHDDGRGAALDAWDQRAINQIYGPPTQ